MGVVVRGTDQKLERPVAVKLPPPQLAALPQFRDRFLREARAQARLTHAAIGRVLDVPDVPPGEIPVLVLEFLEGEDLGARLERVGPEAVDVVLGRVREAAAGLAHAHAKGVLHRDVKPSNLMLVDGRVRILDFGLAAVEGSDKLTTTGMVMGSLPYMPPEQLRGEEVAAPADQFALAVSAFELLTGALPFGPEDRAREAPADLAEARSEVSPELAAALRRGMSADPTARFPDLEAFGAAV
jgi:serine/threonine-protein kinase